MFEILLKVKGIPAETIATLPAPPSLKVNFLKDSKVPVLLGEGKGWTIEEVASVRREKRRESRCFFKNNRTDPKGLFFFFFTTISDRFLKTITTPLYSLTYKI